GDDPAVVMAARDDGNHHVRAAGRGCRGGPPGGGLHDGIGGGQLAQRRDVLARAGAGQHLTGAVQGRDDDVEQPGDLGGDLAQPASGQYDLHHRPVRLLGAGEHGGLAVEDVGEHLVEDVVEGDVVGELDQREAEPVGLFDHLAGQLIQVAAELDGQGGQAPL